MNEETNFSEHLKKLLEKIKKNKIYGSIEIYFENGKVTQITQRIINKIHHKPTKEITQASSNRKTELVHPNSGEEKTYNINLE